MVDSMTLTQSLSSILNQFNKTRNVAVNFAEKQRARDYILKTFRDQGLYTWTEEFQSNNAQVNYGLFNGFLLSWEGQKLRTFSLPEWKMESR